MPFLVPETLPDTQTADSEAFAMMRRRLPDDMYVWHASALELADDEALSFLLMSEDAGIAALFPLDAGVNPADIGDVMTAQKARFAAFKAMLEGSELPALVDDAGQLMPALHHVCLMMTLTGRQINVAGLRTLAADVVLLGTDELDQLTDILASATPQMRRITPGAFNAVRVCVSPSLEIPFASKRKNPPGMRPEDAGWQPVLLDVNQELAVKSFADIPAEQHNMARDLDTRMIRGVAGSGKSLVLLHRAHYLAQHNPDWKILVLTYNRALADFLNARHAEMPHCSSNITIQNFHSWCRSELVKVGMWMDPMSSGSPRGLLTNMLKMQETPVDPDEVGYLLEEFNWIREMDIRTLDAYLDVERRGRRVRFDEAKRRQVWACLEQYQARMKQDKTPDWEQLISDMIVEIENDRIPRAQYHAILIDEAQDFAPLWLKIVQTQLRPATNSLFLVADAAQKIYRRPVSWRSLGIDLHNRRIRILKKSYRNTYQILKAANDVVADTSVVNDLKGEGEEIIAPELDKLAMREGAVPILWQVKDEIAQARVIVAEIKQLQHAGFAWDDVAIFTRSKWKHNGQNPLLNELRRASVPFQIASGQNINFAADQVKLLTLHASRGLEFSAVFVADVDQVKPAAGLDAEEYEQQMADARRLLYVGMTRARDRLYLLHSLPLPDWLNQSLISVERNTPIK